MIASKQGLLAICSHRAPAGLEWDGIGIIHTVHVGSSPVVRSRVDESQRLIGCLVWAMRQVAGAPFMECVLQPAEPHLQLLRQLLVELTQLPAERTRLQSELTPQLSCHITHVAATMII